MPYDKKIVFSELRLIIDGYDGLFYSDRHVDSVADARLKAFDYMELDVSIIVEDRKGKIVERIK